MDVLKLEGNKVYVDAGVVKDTKNIVAKAEQEAIIQQSITSFEEDGALLGNSSSNLVLMIVVKLKTGLNMEVLRMQQNGINLLILNVNKEKI